MPADPIKVLLADDHTLFRNGLAGLLASYGGMEVVGSTPNGEDAVALVERTRPDVVLMQVQIPFERAKDILTKMRAVSPPPKVVIVTMFESPRYLRELMDLGASAYLIKSASTQHLIGAIRAALFDPQGENVVVGMPRGMLEEARKGSRGVLSARELEILLLAARGLSNMVHHAMPTTNCNTSNTRVFDPFNPPTSRSQQLLATHLIHGTVEQRILVLLLILTNLPPDCVAPTGAFLGDLQVQDTAISLESLLTVNTALTPESHEVSF